MHQLTYQFIYYAPFSIIQVAIRIPWYCTEAHGCQIPWVQFYVHLTHWLTHIYGSKFSIIGSDNGLSPGWRQAIIGTNARKLLMWPLGTKFSEILIEIHILFFQKMYSNLSPHSVNGINMIRLQIAMGNRDLSCFMEPFPRSCSYIYICYIIKVQPVLRYKIQHPLHTYTPPPPHPPTPPPPPPPPPPQALQRPRIDIC